MVSSIAVIGATGMLGQPVTRELIRAGYAVRLIVRDRAKAQRLFPGSEVVGGDLRDQAGLVSALRGVNAVYLNLSVRQDEKQDDFHAEGEGLANLLEAARQTGIRRIGYLSSLIMRYQGVNGFSWWVFDVKHAAVRQIRASGIAYSIFYPSTFMETLNASQRAGRFVLLVGRSGVRPWYVSGHDYGRQVARAFRIAQDDQHQEYVVQGPQALTQHEAAERFVAAYRNENLSVLTTPPWLMQLGRPFSARADYAWHITEALNQYPETFEAERAWAELGKPEATIEEFARQVNG